jgi:hypothetical protein
MKATPVKTLIFHFQFVGLKFTFNIKIHPPGKYAATNHTDPICLDINQQVCPEDRVCKLFRNVGNFFQNYNPLKQIIHHKQGIKKVKISLLQAVTHSCIHMKQLF